MVRPTILDESESDDLELERRADGRFGGLRRDIGCDQQTGLISPVHLEVKSCEMASSAGDGVSHFRKKSLDRVISQIIQIVCEMLQSRVRRLSLSEDVLHGLLATL
jgi:hypothetical protein